MLPVPEKCRYVPHLLYVTHGAGASSQKSAATRVVPALIFTVLSLFWMITPSHGNTLKLVALGDSLSAGFGLAQGESFPDQLAASLKLEFPGLTVLNAGVSGDTSAGGLARFEWSVPEDTDVVMVGLGGNYLLRGQPPAALRANLEAIIQKAQAGQMKVVLLGMRAPTNYGPAYQAAFDAIYPDLASEYGTGLVPFLLEGVAGEKELNLPDGIHPNSDGIQIMVRNSRPHVAAQLRAVMNDK